jgi:hypothetical protein
VGSVSKERSAEPHVAGRVSCIVRVFEMSPVLVIVLTVVMFTNITVRTAKWDGITPWFSGSCEYFQKIVGVSLITDE